MRERKFRILAVVIFLSLVAVLNGCATMDDVEAVKADLAKKGLEVVLTRKRAGGFSAAYIDARKVGGVTFEFIQLPKESV